MSTPQTDVDTAHETKDVDISAAGRGVWLVKVPKYLSEQWKMCPSGTDVGKLKIPKAKIPGKKPDIVFTSFDLTSKMAPSPQDSVSATAGAAVSKQLPTGANIRNHKFIVTNVGNQNLVVMSQAKLDAPGKDAPSEKISIEGKVLQRAECHPIVDANYKQLKKEQVQAQNTPQRQTVLLTGIVNSYKPVSDHFSSFEERKAKKAEKRSRAEKDKVMDVLFNAFEKHQFYNVKDLVGITKQPVPYLKEILNEICNYNMTAPHKNMWELKPEFRHYKPHDEGT